MPCYIFVLDCLYLLVFYSHLSKHKMFRNGSGYYIQSIAVEFFTSKDKIDGSKPGYRRDTNIERPKQSLG